MARQELMVARYELTKSVEARKMNKRSGLPLPEPPTIIPYGSVIDDLKRDRGAVRFIFLFELYEVAESVLDSAIREAGGAPAASASPAAEAAETTGSPFVWQQVSAAPVAFLRAKVPGGWLLGSNGTVSFYPDPDHVWDGRSLD
jgi:hypothetical protein